MFEALTLYKLIVLYMLDNSSAPLENAKISDFVLEKEYTDYFTLQQAMAELCESDLVKIESTKNNAFYHITKKGQETLNFFKDKISPAIIDDINSYIAKNKLQIINTASIITDYYKSIDSSYIANCKVREKNSVILDLSISVDTKEQAERICKNWKFQNEAIYSYLMKMLFD